MNKILQLSREYRKLNHVELLPHTNNEILEKLFFLYDEKWEEQSQYPYEILTYLFDSLCIARKTGFGVAVLLAGYQSFLLYGTAGR